jgi:hypothetical protein
MDCMRIVMIVSSTLLLAGCSQSPIIPGPTRFSRAVEAPAEPSGPGTEDQTRQLEEQWGVKVERASLSTGGYMLDFRYRGLDATKAAPILNRTIKPYLIDQATGAKFIVPTPPKVGQLRSGGKIREGAVYYTFFANPGCYIKSGNKVTVVVGDFQARDVVVQ